MVATAELPSLMSDRTETARLDTAMRAESAPDGTKPDRSKFDALLPARLSRFKKGLHFSAGDIDYQLNRQGLKANFFYGTTPVNILVGFHGQYRMEFAGPARGSKIKLSYIAHGDDANRVAAGYRIEFSTSF